MADEDTQHVPQRYSFSFSNTKAGALEQLEEQRKTPGVPASAADLVKYQLDKIEGDSEMVTVSAHGGVIAGGSHDIWAHNIEIHHVSSEVQRRAKAEAAKKKAEPGA